MGFRRSLAVGKVGEKLVRKILAEAGFVVAEEDGGELWDLKTVSPCYTFEVKFDSMSNRTGNLALEYYNTRSCKPSGITVTTADFWVYVLDPTTAWIAATNVVRNYYCSISPAKEVFAGGDGNAAIKLYHREEMLSVFHRLDGLSPLETKALLEKVFQENVFLEKDDA